MATEFVVYDENGVEVDWIDPVIDAEETEDSWFIYNGYGMYKVNKQPGYRYEIEAGREGEGR